jgi:flagellar biosynthesis protein FliQ
MTPADLYDLSREALALALWLSVPILGAALLAAVLTGLLQLYTRMSEPAITQLARIVAVLLATLAAVPWIAGRVTGFATHVWSLVQQLPS